LYLGFVSNFVVENVPAERAMRRRKGEITPAQIDRECPHQVIISSSDVAGPQGGVTAIFFANLGIQPRTHTVRKNDEWHTIYCFADPQHADSFIALFGGNRFDPKTRGKGAGWARLK
jgi:hypothetical protein